jgi:ABC-type nickel/cobalt efflux system permease component RcnA
MLGLAPAGAAGQGGPQGLASADGRAAYMEALFNAGMTRALSDTAAAEPEETVDAIASQAIAFARLAGFLAGQLPPEADLFRTTMEAMMAGHAETSRLSREYRHQQDHAHGHSHDHDHDHSHDHHH